MDSDMKGNVEVSMRGKKVNLSKSLGENRSTFQTGVHTIKLCNRNNIKKVSKVLNVLQSYLALNELSSHTLSQD